MNASLALKLSSGVPGVRYLIAVPAGVRTQAVFAKYAPKAEAGSCPHPAGLAGIN